MRPNEKKWMVTELECLALLTAIKENHVYLASRQFQVYTDHVSLKYIHSLKVSSNNRLARWAIALQPYTFTVNYKEGKKLTAADGLSRRGYPSPPTVLILCLMSIMLYDMLYSTSVVLPAFMSLNCLNILITTLCLNKNSPTLAC